MISVTFNLDTNSQSFDTVFITNSSYNWSSLELEKINNSFYSITIEFEENITLQYKYYAFKDGYQIWEVLPESCSVSQHGNRELTLSSSNLNLPIDIFGKCF